MTSAQLIEENFYSSLYKLIGFPGGSVVKNGLPMQGMQVRKVPRRRKWQPPPVFLPGKSQGPRRLVGYSPWGCKELDTT